MALLTINGVDLDVLVKGGDRVWEEIGDSARALDGTYVSTRTTLKRHWSLMTATLLRADADAWSTLLLGRGHVWRFIDEYSEKGMAKTSVTGVVTYNVAAGKFNKKVQLNAGANIKWTPTGQDSLLAGALNPVGDYTLVVWRLETAVWHQYIIVSTAGTIARYKDGALLGAGAATFLFVTAGVIQLGDGTNADDFSDMVAIPVAIPTAWITGAGTPWYSYGRAFPALPQVEATGLLMSSPTTPVACRTAGLVEHQEPFTSGSTWQADGKKTEFTLLEV